MVSTPYAPDCLFDSIEKETDETCIYKRILLDYTYGLDKIYTREEIEKAKISPSFEREYNLKYLGGIGNVFHTKDIDLAIEKGKLDFDAYRLALKDYKFITTKVDNESKIVTAKRKLYHR